MPTVIPPAGFQRPRGPGAQGPRPLAVRSVGLTFGRPVARPGPRPGQMNTGYIAAYPQGASLGYPRPGGVPFSRPKSRPGLPASYGAAVARPARAPLRAPRPGFAAEPEAKRARSVNAAAPASPQLDTPPGTPEMDEDEALFRLDAMDATDLDALAPESPILGEEDLVEDDGEAQGDPATPPMGDELNVPRVRSPAVGEPDTPPDAMAPDSPLDDPINEEGSVCEEETAPPMVLKAKAKPKAGNNASVALGTPPNAKQGAAFERGMIVKVDRSRLGWIDTAFDEVDEYWVVDVKSKLYVCKDGPNGNPAEGEVRSFKSSEMTPTGSWSTAVTLEISVPVPADILTRILEQDNWEIEWSEKTKAIVQIEHPVDGAPGRIVVGPSQAPDAKAAERLLLDYIHGLETNPEVTERVEISSEVLSAILAADGLKDLVHKCGGVKLGIQRPPRNGALGAIVIGPGTESKVADGLVVLQSHLEEIEQRSSQSMQDLTLNDGTDELQTEYDSLAAEMDAETTTASKAGPRAPIAPKGKGKLMLRPVPPLLANALANASPGWGKGKGKTATPAEKIQQREFGSSKARPPVRPPVKKDWEAETSWNDPKGVEDPKKAAWSAAPADAWKESSRGWGEKKDDTKVASSPVPAASVAKPLATRASALAAAAAAPARGATHQADDLAELEELVIRAETMAERRLARSEDGVQTNRAPHIMAKLKEQYKKEYLDSLISAKKMMQNHPAESTSAPSQYTPTPGSQKSNSTLRAMFVSSLESSQTGNGKTSQEKEEPQSWDWQDDKAKSRHGDAWTDEGGQKQDDWAQFDEPVDEATASDAKRTTASEARARLAALEAKEDGVGDDNQLATEADNWKGKASYDKKNWEAEKSWNYPKGREDPKKAASSAAPADAWKDDKKVASSSVPQNSAAKPAASRVSALAASAATFQASPKKSAAQQAEEEAFFARAAKATAEEQAEQAALAAAQAQAPKPDAQKTLQDWANDQSMFRDLPSLPSNWIRVKSRSGSIYFANLLTGQTTTIQPLQPQPVPQAMPPLTQERALPPGWEVVRSQSTGKVYYWNAEFRRSQFERPG